MEILVEQLKTFSQDIVASINILLAQLNPESKELREEDIRDIIESQPSYFFVAREKTSCKIIGMLTLIIYRIPAWKKGWIEDVVVDREYRGQGIATKLINHAVEVAKTNGVHSIDLTSRPERENANRLYIKLGFKKRDTNVYRIEL